MTTSNRIPSIKELIGDLELGFDFLESAGKKLVVMKSADFDVFDRIMEADKWFTREMLETLLMIGKKEIHPRLMLLPKHVYSKVVGLPYEEQERIVSEKVIVPASLGPEGRPLGGAGLKSAKDLTRAESARVWGSGHRGHGFGEPSPRMDLCLDDSIDDMITVDLSPAAPSNQKTQFILLDENGCAVVVFRKRIPPAAS